MGNHPRLTLTSLVNYSSRHFSLLCLIKMDAGPGFEPGSRAYETRELPLLYPAPVLLNF